MELFIFVLMKYLGYFLFMIIFGTIAVITAKNITAKKRVSWICYAIGAGAQLFALIGNQKQANYYGYDVSTDWFVYFFLLIVFAVLIAMREGAAYYNSGYGKKSKRTLVKKAEVSAEQAERQDDSSGVIVETATQKPAKVPPFPIDVAEEVVPQEKTCCDTAAMKPMPAKEKKRFCSRCGSKIDPVTKKCTGCGRQYFKFNKSVAIILVLVTALASVSTLSVCQFENNQRLQLQIDALKSELKDSQTLGTKIAISHMRVIIGSQVHKIDCPKVNPDMSYRIIGLEGRIQAVLSGYKSCPVCN